MGQMEAGDVASAFPAVASPFSRDQQQHNSADLLRQSFSRAAHSVIREWRYLLAQRPQLLCRPTTVHTCDCYSYLSSRWHVTLFWDQNFDNDNDFPFLPSPSILCASSGTAKVRFLLMRCQDTMVHSLWRVYIPAKKCLLMGLDPDQ